MLVSLKILNTSQSNENQKKINDFQYVKNIYFAL